MTTPLLIALIGLLQDEAGATTAEYGLLIAFIAFVAFTSVGALGRSVSALFSPPTSFIAGTPWGR